MSPVIETEEEFHQLLMPCGLRNEFLDAIHRDLAGHLGVTKTAAHVVRRAYWFNWRRDVNFYIKKCKMCRTYHRSRVQPDSQEKLIPLLTGSPVKRWACDLAGPFPKSALRYPDHDLCFYQVHNTGPFEGQDSCLRCQSYI